MISAILVLGLLGLCFGLTLAYATKIFSVKIDPRIEKIAYVLPGANCGACGRGGCMGLAESLIKGPMPDTVFCPPGGEEVSKRISEILGIETKEQIKTKITIVCNGGINAKDKFIYRGIEDCNAALTYYDGQKLCRYACLGFGSCVRACPFGAMKMGEDGLPFADDKLCTRCGKCIKSCPRGLITTRPKSARVYIKCNSEDKGKVVATSCKVGCIGCGKCVKACPVNAIMLVDNLARIDYDKCDNCKECVEACPTHVIKTEET